MTPVAHGYNAEVGDCPPSSMSGPESSESPASRGPGRISFLAALLAGVALGRALGGRLILGVVVLVAIGRALLGRLIRPEPEISAITGEPLQHLQAGAVGRSGLASALFLHGGILALILLGVGTAAVQSEDGPLDLPGLVFLVEAGPGGGGGGGGDESEEEPAELQAEGEDQALVAMQTAPDPDELVFDPVEVQNEEMIEEAIQAPFAAQMPDPDSLAGLIRDASALFDPRRAGSGRDGGAGSGSGGGIGEGDGDGLGEGFGGGFGGGAYRIGSGVEPPQLRRQVTPEYTDDALARKIEGSVILEVVILKSGRVGPARIIRSLDAGLDERAIAAVREWRFAPGRFRGEAVDVLAEIEVEFRLL